MEVAILPLGAVFFPRLGLGLGLELGLGLWAYSLCVQGVQRTPSTR